MTEEEERKKEKVGVRICWINQQIKNRARGVKDDKSMIILTAFFAGFRAKCEGQQGKKNQYPLFPYEILIFSHLQS